MMTNYNEKAVWGEVEVTGEVPSERYGHTLTFSNPFVILFGGNTSTQTLNDAWCLNTSKAPFTWTKLVIKGELPLPRVYHSAAHCQQGAATGMIVIFGGRHGQAKSLNDTWGSLAINRSQKTQRRKVGLGQSSLFTRSTPERKVPALLSILGNTHVHHWRKRVWSQRCNEARRL